MIFIILKTIFGQKIGEFNFIPFLSLTRIRCYFKEKIRERNIRSTESKEALSLSPEIRGKLEEEGINPETVTLQQLFPETLEEGGSYLSLMSGEEWEIMITYLKTRKYLLEKYPQSPEQARMQGQPWEEEPEAPYQIDNPKVREDPKSKVFLESLDQMKVIYYKVDFLQRNASDYVIWSAVLFCSLLEGGRGEI